MLGRFASFYFIRDRIIDIWFSKSLKSFCYLLFLAPSVFLPFYFFVSRLVLFLLGRFALTLDQATKKEGRLTTRDRPFSQHSLGQTLTDQIRKRKKRERAREREGKPQKKSKKRNRTRKERKGFCICAPFLLSLVRPFPPSFLPLAASLSPQRRGRKKEGGRSVLSFGRLLSLGLNLHQKYRPEKRPKKTHRYLSFNQRES